eukprot:1104911-Amphidinium_carterae.2
MACQASELVHYKWQSSPRKHVLGKIDELNLNGTVTWKLEVVNTIAAVLSRENHVQSLELYENRIGESMGKRELLPSRRHSNQTAASWSISLCIATASGTRELLPSWRHSNQTAARLSDFLCRTTALVPQEFRPLAGAQVAQLPAYKALYLSANHIRDAGVSPLSQALKSDSCKLEELGLDKNHIGDAGAFALSEALQSDSCKLVRLRLSLDDIHIGDVGKESDALA